MKKIFLIVVAMIWGLCNLYAAAPVKGRVVKYPLNIRAGAGTKYTSIAQLTKDNQVEIVRCSKQWLEIKPTANCVVWILKRYIKNGKLTANVNFRSGPGTGYEAVGGGKVGMAVEVKGDATKSGWISIAAPDSVRVYVGRDAIEADSKELAALPKFESSAGRALPNKDLILMERNFTSPGREVRITGEVYDFKSDVKAITHLLYEPKGDELLPKYFLIPSRGDLKAYDSKKVRITGECYQVKNWDMPVIVVQKVTVVE